MDDAETGERGARLFPVHDYGAKFSNGQTVPLTITFDKDGKIAGFGN